MPYDQSYRTLVLNNIYKLQAEGQIYRRKKHTIDMILHKYTLAMQNKYTLLGNTILQHMTKHIQTIFETINDNSNFEVLEFLNNVIKWYFKLLATRQNAKEQITLPDYTVPEIKDIYYNINT